MLFPLAFAPTLNMEDYFMRKGNYVIKGLFICDDAANITWIEMGWPGSVHNNQVWSNSDIYLSKEKYFSNKVYLLVIWHFPHHQLWFLLSKRATIPT